MRNNMKKINLKDLLNENTPGFENRKFGDSLPTLDSVQKAYQAKNNINMANLVDPKEPIKEEYVESMNSIELDKHLGEIAKLWKKWKNGPMTERSDIKPAGDELTHYILLWMRKTFK